MPSTRSRGLELLLTQVEGKPVAMVALARLMQKQGDKALCVKLCTRALDLAPNDGEVRAIAAEVLSADVPQWHFNIVRDIGRNEAYEAALRRAVFPGCKVLEIGAGTGLLAMMAARAGAGEVITCESDCAVAAAAQEIVARNGYADRVRVLAKHSTAIDVQADLGGPADILVSEIIADDLLGEGTLPACEHAVRHLIKPGALVIPGRGFVRVALADDDEWESARMDQIAGFDLSVFNRLARPHREFDVGTGRLTLRSEAADMFAFDFASGGPFPEATATVTLSAQSRRINGIAQWIALEMDQEGRYENRPEPGARSSWSALFYPFDRPLDVVPGDKIMVHARHNRGALRIWADTTH
jgi:protein arginine N-methyltransferase 7